MIEYLLFKFLIKLRLKGVKNSKISRLSKIESGSLIVNSIIGKYSFCGYDCTIINTTIGHYCSISSGVKIGEAMHPIEWASTSPVFYKGKDSISKKFSNLDRTPDKKTEIGHDVWIGSNVLIKQGVKIGNGSIIAMGSVVTKDIPDYSIAGGVPAKVIRNRFTETEIKYLNEMNWYHWDDKKLNRFGNSFNNVEKLYYATKREDTLDV